MARLGVDIGGTFTDVVLDTGAGMVSQSSRVSPQMREYERFNTTIANAYIKPLRASYLGRLENRLAREGADCPIYLMHSGGGIMALEAAAEFPVRLVESGPAGGAIFAADLAVRPGLDGMNATAFPWGVMTMPVEATEQVGPVIIWRKELRPDSGGAGQYRGGLGQVMEVGARAGHEFDISAMLDRVDHPARGRRGGQQGAPTRIARDDGTPMRSNGRQSVPHGACVQMAFPGGAGYGVPGTRAPEAVRRDLALGYITAEVAREVYGLSPEEIEKIEASARRGESF